MTVEQTAPTPPFTHHRALVLIRERLNERDAIEHVPLHIQADLEQLLVESIDLPENSPCAAGDYHEGLAEGIGIGRREGAQDGYRRGAIVGAFG